MNKKPHSELQGQRDEAAEVTFPCSNCGEKVPAFAYGTKNRNHCPFCLHSLHVAKSREQHDRTSQCLGLMEPIAISAQKDAEWSLVHRCVRCGNIKTNRIAGDDDTLALLCIALKPLERLPFPLDQVLFEAQAKVNNQDKGKPA